MRSVMFFGTSSNVGKSVLSAAFCRIFAQDGLSVAPFKAQNMSLNAAVTPSGREIGRAQAAQAEAAGIPANEHMNPVLLKPTGPTRSQVVVQGVARGHQEAAAYFRSDKSGLWKAVCESYAWLRERHDLIVIEGAGSPVELNLRDRDIANTRVAEMADAAVFLVADIERGGVFASVLGTLHLLPPHERMRVRGVIINKFRGDPGLFADGVAMLEERAGVPVVGVVPYLEDIGIDEEDSLALQSERYPSRPAGAGRGDRVRVAVVRLPHISNFTDLDPLMAETDVDVWLCADPDELRSADAAIIPGSKNTPGDLRWLFDRGFFPALRGLREAKKPIAGLCGGFQMLGERVRDPLRIESDGEEVRGLGFLAVETVLGPRKRTVLAQGRTDLLGEETGLSGYEMHMGQTVLTADAAGRGERAFARLLGPDGQGRPDGAASRDGRVFGTYLHGVFHNDRFRTAWLNRIRMESGLPVRREIPFAASREASYDRLAEAVRRAVDLEYVYSVLRDGD